MVKHIPDLHECPHCDGSISKINICTTCCNSRLVERSIVINHHYNIGINHGLIHLVAVNYSTYMTESN